MGSKGVSLVMGLKSMILLFLLGFIIATIIWWLYFYFSYKIF